MSQHLLVPQFQSNMNEDTYHAIIEFYTNGKMSECVSKTKNQRSNFQKLVKKYTVLSAEIVYILNVLVLCKTIVQVLDGVVFFVHPKLGKLRAIQSHDVQNMVRAIHGEAHVGITKM